MESAAVVVACALVLLGRPADKTPALVFLEQPPPGVSRSAEAFVTRSPDTIHLITSAAVFRDARSARPQCANWRAQVKLASILAHELWHLEHGPDEREAYNRQLSTLLWLGVEADSLLYAEVRASMSAALKAEKARKAGAAD